MNPDQTVSQMVEQVLSRQARRLADLSGMNFGEAMDAVVATEAGAQLKALGQGEHRHEKARAWQAGLILERARQRARDLGWQWRQERSGPSPSERAPIWSSPPELESVKAGSA